RETMPLNRNLHPSLLALAWGALCGARSMLPLALLSQRVKPTSHASRLQHHLSSPTMKGAVQTMAALELAADKASFMPARTSPPALLGRALNGALLGALSAAPMSPLERAACTPPKESRCLASCSWLRWERARRWALPMPPTMHGAWRANIGACP